MANKLQNFLLVNNYLLLFLFFVARSSKTFFPSFLSISQTIRLQLNTKRHSRGFRKCSRLAADLSVMEDFPFQITDCGIQSIDKGQMEAAYSLGMNWRQAMFKIIIPQSVKRLLPPMGNEFITLIKDTSLVSVISMVELLRDPIVFGLMPSMIVLGSFFACSLLLFSLSYLVFGRVKGVISDVV